MNSEMNAAKMRAANVPEIDFSAWESKVETPGLVAALKAAYEKEILMPEFEKALAEEQAKAAAETKELFHGSDGLVRAASLSTLEEERIPPLLPTRTNAPPAPTRDQQRRRVDATPCTLHHTHVRP